MRNDLCHFNDVYIVVTGKFTATNPGNNDDNDQLHAKNKQSIIEDVQDLDIVIPMYNLFYYSKNLRKTTGSFWNCYPDMP